MAEREKQAGKGLQLGADRFLEFQASTKHALRQRECVHTAQSVNHLYSHVATLLPSRENVSIAWYH